jgi:hypothetical protein
MFCTSTFNEKVYFPTVFDFLTVHVEALLNIYSDWNNIHPLKILKLFVIFLQLIERSFNKSSRTFSTL